MNLRWLIWSSRSCDMYSKVVCVPHPRCESLCRESGLRQSFFNRTSGGNVSSKVTKKSDRNWKCDYWLQLQHISMWKIKYISIHKKLKKKCLSWFLRCCVRPWNTSHTIFKAPTKNIKILCFFIVTFICQSWQTATSLRLHTEAAAGLVTVSWLRSCGCNMHLICFSEKFKKCP